MDKRIILKLFISGMTPAAKRAVENLQGICNEISNKDQYSVDVIDIKKNPELAEEYRILATPVVIKQLPPPIKRIIGDLSDKEKVLVGLALTDEEL